MAEGTEGKERILEGARESRKKEGEDIHFSVEHILDTVNDSGSVFRQFKQKSSTFKFNK
jgi:hypothetical protein